MLLSCQESSIGNLRIRSTSVALVIFFPLLLFAQRSDSLLVKLQNLSGAERIPVLHQLVVSEWLNYPNLAMAYGEEALSLSEQAQDKFNTSKSLRLIAGVYYYMGDYEVSLDYNIRAFNLATEIQDSVLINNGYNNIGLIYYNLGSYQTALEYLLRAKQIKVRLGELYGLPTTINNIGLVFERVGQYDVARSHFEEALDVSRRANFPDQEVYSLNNIGITYLRQERFDQARHYFDEASQLAVRIANINWGAVSLRGIGEIMLHKGRYDSAVHYFQQSLEASRKIEDKKGISESLYLLAKLSLQQSDFQSAINHLDNSQQLAVQLKLRQQLLDNLKLYALVYQQMNDDTQVILYQARYSNLRDSLFQDVVVRNLSLIPLKIKEEEDRLKLSLQQAEIDKKNSTNRLYIIIILLVIPFTVFLVILVRRNITANRILRESNEELKRTQSLLITAEKMASLGTLASGIGHEINNPLNFIMNGAKALQSRIEQRWHGKTNDLEPFFEAINEGVVRASKVVRSLSHFSKAGEAIIERCDVHEIINNCLIILNNRIRNKAEVIKSFTDREVIVSGDEGKLHQAFMNILSNAEQAIEHEGVIVIVTNVKDGHVLVSIKDNGVGIAEEHLQKISDPFFTTKPAGIGTGLGLFITYSIVEEHKGSIKVASKPNVETEFIVSLPLHTQ
jgi:signal transduction histidine kinase